MKQATGTSEATTPVETTEAQAEATTAPATTDRRSSSGKTVLTDKQKLNATKKELKEMKATLAEKDDELARMTEEMEGQRMKAETYFQKTVKLERDLSDAENKFNAVMDTIKENLMGAVQTVHLFKNL